MKLLNMGANADVHEKLGKFIDRANDLQAKVEELEEANKQLADQLRFKGRLLRVGGLLFAVGDDEALCARCAEVDRKLVHLLPQAMAFPACPQCKTKYTSAILLRSRLDTSLPETPFIL
ncbi:hypothetical protein [Granulicella arctica]|uniref:Uncharacterized protein n=1 Tax=Granulicella arctica TaxID=940613 RepID=A0A7Y9PIV4_9BACT|nr:hypothetical protein [Granulicella arctica]NYF80564.1 hypothetical protein [Granulicella arctica]